MMTSTPHLFEPSLETPAFVYDADILRAQLDRVLRLQDRAGLLIRFSLKAFTVLEGVQLIAERLGGLEASSLFEAMLAREILGENGSVHFTSPGVRPKDMGQLLRCCDYASANSLAQLQLMSAESRDRRPALGVRVNPGLSYAADPRFDPCSPDSKLGIPLGDVARLFESGEARSAGVSGLHFHSNCESSHYSQLHATVRHLRGEIPSVLRQVAWVNLGGGYLVDEAEDEDDLRMAVELLRGEYGVKVFMEPGEGLVRRAGFIVTSVLDLFERAGSRVAVLDTTVNHMPEVFEYGVAPEITSAIADGGERYTLTGCSCLAGDRLGTYSFRQPLRVGDRLVIRNAGAYTFVKANMFNGINLPTVYCANGGELKLLRAYDFGDFISRCGAGRTAELAWREA